MSQSQRQRGPKAPCANPLFEQWLTEWREDAALKNSKMQFVYAKALGSLRKYPLPLKSGKDCLILEYFGPSIAKMIDKRMEQEGMDLDETPGLSDIIHVDDVAKKGKKKKVSVPGDGVDGEVSQTHQPEPVGRKKKETKKTYVPAYRSGGYALLVAIALREAKQGYRGYMTKSELLQDAQQHCDASMTRGESGGTYTSWNSMSTLVNKGLVVKQGQPTKFMLSPEGRELALKLLQAENGTILTNVNLDPVVEVEEEVEEALDDSALNFRRVLEPGEFEVLLYVDTSETVAQCKQEEVIKELRKNGVAMEVVRLSVGDFVWVCRKLEQTQPNSKRLTVSKSAELVIPFVVERKRSDDLAHSIKDGRFHEQKFRLRQTGLQPIYLHENYGRGDFGLADGALQQALANTQMTDGFLVQETNSIKDTCAYLTHMTRHFKSMYENKRISSCTREEWPRYKDRGSSHEVYLMTFSDFNDFGTKAKNWTVTEMLAKHLMRLRGLSVERAYAIVQKYPTITALIEAYENCSSDKEKDLLLAGIYYGAGGRPVGTSIGKTLTKLYNSRTLPN